MDLVFLAGYEHIVVDSWVINYHVSVTESTIILRFLFAHRAGVTRYDLADMPEIKLGSPVEDVATAVGSIQVDGLRIAVSEMLSPERQERIKRHISGVWAQTNYGLRSVFSSR